MARKQRNYENTQAKSKINPSVRLTDKQKDLTHTIRTSTFTFVSGPWGTSKTFTSCLAALEMLEAGAVDKIVVCKPIVESQENIGFLKGELDDKLGPYAESFKETFAKLTDDKYAQYLWDSKTIEFKPIAYIRGKNYDNCIVIADECQNYNESQLITLITRLGETSKMVLIGDSRQADVKVKDSGFSTFLNILEGVPSISQFAFGVEDIKRHPILIEITKRYENWKDGKSKGTLIKS